MAARLERYLLRCACGLPRQTLATGASAAACVAIPAAASSAGTQGERRVFIAAIRWQVASRVHSGAYSRLRFPLRSQLRSRLRGASLVEFVIAVPALMVLFLALAQLSLMMIVRAQLDYATERAARHAALHNGTAAALREGLLPGLAGMQPGNGEPSMLDLQQRMLAARLLLQAGLVRVERIAPAPACFVDWGSPIPNSFQDARPSRPGRHSGLSVQDCNILKVRVIYAYKPVMPVIRHLWLATLRALFPLEPIYHLGRIPVEASAIVHMHSDVKQ